MSGSPAGDLTVRETFFHFSGLRRDDLGSSHLVSLVGKSPNCGAIPDIAASYISSALGWLGWSLWRSLVIFIYFFSGFFRFPIAPQSSSRPTSAAGGGGFREVQQSSGAGNPQSRGTHSRPRGKSLWLDHAAPRAERAALRAVLRVTVDLWWLANGHVSVWCSPQTHRIHVWYIC